jgi:hypothetical protein
MSSASDLGLGLAAPPADLLDHRLQRLVAAATADHGRAQGGQLQGHRAPQAGSGAGDGAHLPVEQPGREDA